MRFGSMLVCGVALALSVMSTSALAATAAEPVDVDSLTVFASTDVRVTVAIGGDVSVDQVVSSAPVGVRCGGAMFQYTNVENRQCWLWVRRNQPVILTAQGKGVYGRDWSVVWSGCEPVGGGPACTLTPSSEAVVAAVFGGGVS